MCVMRREEIKKKKTTEVLNTYDINEMFSILWPS